MKNLEENYKNYLEDCETQEIEEVLNIDEYEKIMDEQQDEFWSNQEAI